MAEMKSAGHSVNKISTEADKTQQPEATRQPEAETQRLDEVNSGLAQGTSSQIDSVLRAIGYVLEGSPTFTGAMLRQEIVNQMPQDLAEAEKYNNAMQKMRVIGELVSQVSNEEYLVRKSRS